MLVQAFLLFFLIPLHVSLKKNLHECPFFFFWYLSSSFPFLLSENVQKEKEEKLSNLMNFDFHLTESEWVEEMKTQFDFLNCDLVDNIDIDNNVVLEVWMSHNLLVLVSLDLFLPHPLHLFDVWSCLLLHIDMFGIYWLDTLENAGAVVAENSLDVCLKFVTGSPIHIPEIDRFVVLVSDFAADVAGVGLTMRVIVVAVRMVAGVPVVDGLEQNQVEIVDLGNVGRVVALGIPYIVVVSALHYMGCMGRMSLVEGVDLASYILFVHKMVGMDRHQVVEAPCEVECAHRGVGG